MISTVVSISLEKETSCLQNTFLLGASISRDTTVGDSAPYNPCLGHRYSVVAKWLKSVIIKINFFFLTLDIVYISDKLVVVRLLRTPAGNCMFKVNSKITTTRCEICSKLIIKTPERRQCLYY